MTDTFCPCQPCLPDEIELEEEELSSLFRKMKRLVSAPITGEEIWKKFELPPTPPRSPVKTEVEETHYESTVADRLQRVSESLDDEDCPEITALNLGSKLIQDCMWNGKVNPVEGDASPCVKDIYETPCSTPPPLDYSSTDCVDPSAVFPYPLNEADRSHSDTDEEIDVVTIEKPCFKRKLWEPSHQNSRITILKRCKSAPVRAPVAIRMKSSEEDSDGSDSNSKRSDPASPPSPSQQAVKSTSLATKGATKKLSEKSLLPTNEKKRDDDSSDPDAKRAFHNVLERKRRNDLKSSFYSLRNYIPSLSKKEKTPKVIILKGAADYINELKARETKLSNEKNELNKIRSLLLAKLNCIVEEAQSL